MAGDGKGSDVAHQAMLVDPVNWCEHVTTAPACKLSPPWLHVDVSLNSAMWTIEAAKS